jgi:hypothetical protein
METIGELGSHFIVECDSAFLFKDLFGALKHFCAEHDIYVWDDLYVSYPGSELVPGDEVLV